MVCVGSCSSKLSRTLQLTATWLVRSQCLTLALLRCEGRSRVVMPLSLAQVPPRFLFLVLLGVHHILVVFFSRLVVPVSYLFSCGVFRSHLVPGSGTSLWMPSCGSRSSYRCSSVVLIHRPCLVWSEYRPGIVSFSQVLLVHRFGRHGFFHPHPISFLGSFLWLWSWCSGSLCDLPAFDTGRTRGGT